MAYFPKIDLAGVLMHVIQRRNNRASCFFADEDYEYYLKCLSMAAAKYECAIHAYVRL